MTDRFDLDWEALQKKSLIRVTTNHSYDFEAQLEVACEKTVFDLTHLFRKHQVSAETAQELMGEMVRRFTSHWKESLKNQDLAGLVEYILEGQQLSNVELSSYLRALPLTFITRICDPEVGGGDNTGIKQVMGVELARRNGTASYQVTKKYGQFCLEVVDLIRDVKFDVFLFEVF